MGTKETIVIAALSLGFGATLGAVVATSADPTSFSQTDLDQASAEGAAAAAAADPVADVDPDPALQEELTAAQTRIEELKSAVGKAELAGKDDAAATQKVIDRLEEKVATLSKRPTPAEVAEMTAPAADDTGGGTDDTEAPAATKVTDLAFTGTVQAALRYPKNAQPWPTDCSGAQSGYVVRVSDPAGDALNTASMSDYSMTARVVKPDGTLYLTCLLTYDVQLPGADDDSYRLDLFTAASTTTPLRTVTVPVSGLSDGTAPAFYAPAVS